MNKVSNANSMRATAQMGNMMFFIKNQAFFFGNEKGDSSFYLAAVNVW